MSQGKVVITALIDGQWIWRAEAPIDPTYIRRMTKDELDRIAKKAVESVTSSYISTVTESDTVQPSDKKKKR